MTPWKMTVVTTTSAYAAVPWVVRSSEKLSINIWGRLEPPGTATCGDCTTATVQIFSYLVQILWPEPDMKISGQLRSCSPHRWQFLVVLAVLIYIYIQCWNIVYWTLWNKFQGNFNRNSNIFIHENEFESVVCEMASILSRPLCVKYLCHVNVE